MLNKGKLLVFISLLLVLLFNSTAKASEEKIEAIFQFSYKTYSTEFIVYLIEEKVYLPLDETLAYLKVYNIVDENRKYTGYMNRADSSFVIDFQNNSFVDIVNVEKKLLPNDWFLLNNQIYLRTELLDEIFKITTHSSFNNLSVSISAKYELPLQRVLRVEYYSNNFNKSVSGDTLGELLYKRNFDWINGGVIDYSINTNYSRNSFRNSFNTGVGLTVLGGELQSSISGSTVDFDPNISNIRYNNRWRLLFDNEYIQSISVLDLPMVSSRIPTTRGYRKPSQNIEGIQVTNESISNSGSFGNYIIEKIIEPNWTVELYLNDKLYEIKRSDLSGYYKFEFPIKYGASKATIKEYGTNGEFNSYSKDISVSTALLKPKELKYVLSAGFEKTSRDKLIDGTLSMGLFDWLTTSVSFNKNEAEKDYTLVSQSSINLFSNYLLNLTFNNVGIYDANIKIPDFLNGNYDFTYVYYNHNVPSLANSQNYSLYLVGNINRIFNKNININITGSHDKHKNSSFSNINSGFSLYFNKFTVNLRHNLSLIDYTKEDIKIGNNLNTQFGYYIDKTPDWLFFLESIRLNLTMDFNDKDWKPGQLSFSLDRQIFRDMYLTFNTSYYTYSKAYNTSLNLNMNLPFARSRFGNNVNSQGEYSGNLDLNGSIEFDSYNGSINMLNTMGSNSNTGRSSAAVKFYVDWNENNKAEDEEIIEEADFFVTNYSTTKIRKSNYWILSNLIPGKRYNIRVRPESFNNPNIIPSSNEFSFIADPYTYKSIDVKCSQGGFLEGNVKITTQEGIKPQNGVKIKIKSLSQNFNKEVLVFSDGSYYFSGLPIGNYRVSVDSLQLKILNCQSNPADYQITIKSSVDGDLVGNINFILNKLDSTTIDKQKAEILPGTALITAGSQPNIEELVNDNIRKNQPMEGSVVVDQPANSKNYIIQFSTKNTTILDIKGTEVLDLITDYLLKNPLLFIDIQGHSCKLDSTELEQNIAIERAATVKNYLISKGIDASKMNIKSVGSSNPLHDNNSEVGKIRNSRVEINIIEK